MSKRFDEAAKTWDQNDTRTRLSSAIAQAIETHVALRPSMRLMDFGAGTGLLSERLAPLVRSIAAVDVSSGMLGELEQKASIKAVVTPYCRNILHDPLEGDFDGIVSAMALHHVEDTRELMKVFFEHLNPGGFIALCDLDAEDGTFHSHGNDGVFHFGFQRDALASFCADAGFEHVRFETAHTVLRESGRGYPIFLLCAVKPEKDSVQAV
ncbi:MAG: class I SAM-dependent methyltransferase [Campylobacterales bacterium]|nr:class I SAM-dependent methyltransferase [Campylobacterales bacterium]